MTPFQTQTDENVDILSRPDHNHKPHKDSSLLSLQQPQQPLRSNRTKSFVNAPHFQRRHKLDPLKGNAIQTTTTTQRQRQRTKKKKKITSNDHTSSSNIVILGDPKCGKSTLLHTYLNQRHTMAPESILFETYTKQINFNNDTTSVKLQIWDFPGDDNFDRFRPLAYANAVGVLICFDLSSPESYHNVKERWIPEVEEHCPQAHRILVGIGAECRLDKDRGVGVPNVDFFQKTAVRIGCDRYFEPFYSSPRSCCKVFEAMALLISGNGKSHSEQQTQQQVENIAVPYLRAATMTSGKQVLVNKRSDMNGVGMGKQQEVRDGGGDDDTEDIENKRSKRRTSFQKKAKKDGHRCIVM